MTTTATIESDYRALFEQASDVILLADLEGKILDINSSGCTLIGYPRVEIIGEKASVFVDQEQLKNDPLTLPQLIEGEHVIRRRRVQRKDGNIIELELNSKRISGDRILTIGRDITELRKVEQQIIVSESTLNIAFENYATGMAFTSPSGSFIKANKQLCDMLGYTEEELLKLTYRDVTHQDDLYATDKYIDRVSNGKLKTFDVEKRYLHKNGTIVWGKLNSTGVMDEEGKLRFFVTQIENITERKENAERLLHEKTLSDTVINELPGIFYISNKDRYLLRWNKNLETVTGYSADEIRTMEMINFVSPVQHEYALMKRQDVFSEGKAAFELNLITKNKEELYYYFKSSIIEYNGAICTLGIGVDITQLKKTQKDLVQSNYDINERIKELTCLYKISEIAADLDYSIEDIFLKSLEIIPPAWQYPEITSASITFEDYSCYRSLNFKESPWCQEENIQVNGVVAGKVKIYYSKQMPEMDEGPFLKEERLLLNAIAKILASSTERRKANMRLQLSEEKYKYLFNNNPSVSIIWDPEQLKILEVNNQAMLSYGYTKEEFENMSIFEYRPEEDYEKIRVFAKHMMENTEVTHKQNVWRHFKKNGELMYMDIVSHKMDYNGRMAVLSLAIDITEKYKAEEQLRKSYEDILTLNKHLQTVREEERSRIAHEIHDELGQQLTGIKMHISLCTSRKQEKDDILKNDIKEINLLIDETVQTVRRIASELRPGILDDLGLIAALEWQCQEFEKHSAIRCNLNVKSVETDLEGELATAVFRIYQESLTNVMRYANASNVECSFENNGQEVLLIVKDNGKGFEVEEALNKKTLGILGMKERARTIGGVLTIESSKGEGTRVLLSIPIKH